VTKRILVYVFAAICVTSCSREETIERARDAGESRTAEITWKQPIPGLTAFSAWLVVKDSAQNELLRTKLFGGRDSAAEIRYEILGLRWDGDDVVVDSRHIHYVGSDRFHLENVQPTR
jgi:hypothetical protein